MADIAKHRSGSLCSLDRKEESESGLGEAGARHYQSSDSLLSLSQTACIDPDTRSQISLPEYGGTVVDSEGYSSFQSNVSSSSSPFSSSQTSPTGDGDLLVDPVDEHTTQEHDEVSQHWKLNLMASKKGEHESLFPTSHLHAKRVLERSQELDNLDTDIRFDEYWHERRFLSNEQDSSWYFNEASICANSENLPEEQVENYSRPVLGSLVLGRQMSTIEECYEETPSPRSFVEIDRNFADAYQGSICHPSLGTPRALRKDKEKGTKAQLSENGYKIEDSKLKPAKEESLDVLGVSSKGKERNEDRDVDIADKKSNFFDGPNNTVSNDVSRIGILGLESDSQDLSALSDQVFDIDLDLYDIPDQRRQSLEIKLNNLRKFVDRIIEDRQCLENDRFYLQQALQLIEGQRYGFTSNVSSLPERSNDTAKFPDEVTGDKECQSDRLGTSGAESKLNAPGPTTHPVRDKDTEDEPCDDLVEMRGQVEKRLPAGNADLEELLCNLEDALLENIELKHMNKDLANANEELRERIEELLTDEEELRYKLNEATLKLMEDGERQKEENSVLRSNFNKVLRDYNSLETEFKELERSYEELIHERDLITDELTVKNDDFQRCKEECIRLTDELEDTKAELENYSKTEERVWTRKDWEQWTLLQTKLSATELALFDARKQKALLVSDLKRMKKSLESGRAKIEDTEKSIVELEKNLKRAQENNESLQSENAELRCSIFEYESKLAEFERLAEKELFKEESELVRCCFGNVKQAREETEPYLDEDCKDIESHDFNSSTFDNDKEIPAGEDRGEIKKSAVLRSDAKSGDIRRARTFPFHDMNALALQLFQEAPIPADTYADSEYQNAFQEIDAESVDCLSDDEASIRHCEGASATTFTVAMNNAEGNGKKSRHPCFSFKGLLPSVLQSILNSKAKKGNQNKSQNRTNDSVNDS